MHSSLRSSRDGLSCGVKRTPGALCRVASPLAMREVVLHFLLVSPLSEMMRVELEFQVTSMSVVIFVPSLIESMTLFSVLDVLLPLVYCLATRRIRRW